MKILVINCGSSSLKYQLMEMENKEVLASGKCDRIGVQSINKPFIEYKRLGGEEIIEELDLPDHTVACEKIVEYLLNPEFGVISDLSEIDAVGHRGVHGGESIRESVIITDEILELFEKCSDFAPLHNPANLQGINACMKTMPGVPQVLVLDTAFHSDMPEHAAMYAIPYEYYEKYGVKRYGFHGTSHKYVTEEASRRLGIDIEDINMISCHLGNGASVAAIRNGKSVDTSMGFTPLEGLIMGTRSGDMDPAIIEFIMHRDNISIEEMTTILNKKSGLLGISGVTGDVRDLKQLMNDGNERAKLALEMFTYRVKKYIGAYMAVLGHVDVITFEGGIGEYNRDLVENCVSNMEDFGIKVNRNRTEEEEAQGVITTSDSRIKVLVIRTNEELKIAEETMELVK
ncbi:MAG: acetate kinase [Oscillospiraceae bacterium]|nr:acetate kinase [Oscillospiraceae bacterium]